VTQQLPDGEFTVPGSLQTFEKKVDLDIPVKLFVRNKAGNCQCSEALAHRSKIENGARIGGLLFADIAIAVVAFENLAVPVENANRKSWGSSRCTYCFDDGFRYT
jgi:hypothetical protein